jgi:hypothetical protein
MKPCTGCGIEKIKKSYRYDDDMCSICYTEKRLNDWVLGCTVWNRTCTKCEKTTNVFTTYLRVKMSGLYPSICHECQKKGNRAYRNKSYVKDSLSIKRIGVAKVLSKKNQRKFVKDWDKMNKALYGV